MTTPNPIHSPFSGQPLSRSKPLEEWGWRHPIHVWYFNPWTGTKRHSSDVKSDPQGWLIQTSDSLVPASSDEGITLDFKQATELLELFEGKPREIVLTVNDGHAGPGLYAFYKDQWLAAIFLGESNKEARPGPERQVGEVPAGGYPPLPEPEVHDEDGWHITYYTESMMRAYVDADRAMRGAQPAPAILPIDEYQRGRRAGITDFYDSLYALDKERAQAALHKIEPQPAPAAQADAKDAARYRWLTDGHERPATRIVRNQLCERLPWMSYSAVSADIDAAIEASKKEPT